MQITTFTPEDTDRFLRMVAPIDQVRQIKKILQNKKSHTEQIKAIKQVLEQS